MGPGSLVVQPIGAVEHHGPHLPTITDALIADRVAGAAVDRLAGDVELLPVLAYGLSTEHNWAAGTISLSPRTLLGVLEDLGASVARAGVGRLAFVNGHGGNTHLLRVAIRELRARHGLYAFLAHCDLPPDQGGPAGDPREEGLGIHGGLAETSLMLHLAPNLVDLTKAERAVPSWLHDYEHVGFGRAADFGWLSNDLTPDGVCGDPTLASAPDGAIRFEEAVDRMANVLTEVSTFEFNPTGR